MTIVSDAAAHSIPPSADIRACGACTLCCKLLPLQELGKPAGKWCIHAKPGIGCSIHGSRPGACRSFQCEWTTNLQMPADWQPDRAKFFIFHSRPNQYDIVVDPGSPHAWKAPHYYGAIKQIAASYAEQGILVVVCIGSRRIVLLPDRDVDLGMQAMGKEIILIRDIGPQGVDFNVEIGGGDTNAPQEPV